MEPRRGKFRQRLTDNEMVFFSRKIAGYARMDKKDFLIFISITNRSPRQIKNYRPNEGIPLGRPN